MSATLTASPLTVDQADVIRRGLPLDTPARMHDHARLEAFDFVVPQFVAQHDKRAQSQRFACCICPLCRMVRPFLTAAPPAQSLPEEEPRCCSEMDERKVPLG